MQKKECPPHPAAIVGCPTVGVSGAQQASLWPLVTFLKLKLFFTLQHFFINGSKSFEMMSEVLPELWSHVAPPAAHITALHAPLDPHPISSGGSVFCRG